MKTRDIVRQVVIDQNPHTVWIGDTVWWCAQGQTDNVPAVATVTDFCGDDMVDLTYITPHSTGKLQVLKGVCLLGDERLKNQNYRSKGAWLPRTAFAMLQIKD